MKSKKDTRSALVALFVLVFSGVLLLPCASSGQTAGSWWGSSSWFDWSDYRATVGARLWLASLESGSATFDGEEHDLVKELGMDVDTQPFSQFCGTLYLDRLGFRYQAEDDHRFFGRTDSGTTPLIHELDVRTPRLGLDLDLIRYSFARLGINYDYHGKPVKFYYRQAVAPEVRLFKSENAMTIGAHGHIIPIRLRGVPVILETRVRFPIPFIDDHFRPEAAKIVDWEICGGLRPAVWDMSDFGVSSFSASIELGYQTRSLRVKLDDPSFDLKAHWQGAFIRLGVFY